AQSRGFKEVTGTRTGYVTVDYAATAAFDVISDVHLSTSVGAQYYRKSIAGHTSRGEVFPAAGVETVSATAIRIGEESFVENKTLGMFVQEQVGWKNRIFLTGALRGDDNSAFGKNFDFVLYPKVSATWVLNEEPWWNLPGVEALKLRAAWGKAGQQPDAFAAARTYRPSVGPGGASTLTPGNVGNPDLEPEVGEELELGFDAGLLNDRLGIEFTYYDQRTKGAIVQKPALPSQGFPGVQFVNIGEVVNSGIELAVNARFLQRPTLNWETTFTLSTNHNEVLDLGGVDPGGGLQRQVVGYPLSSTFMKKIVQAELGADGKATNILCEGGDKVAGGGPPVPCSQAGTAYFGRPTPAWEGSASTSLTLFRNLRLYALVDFVGGHIRRDGDIAAAHLFFYISKEIVTRSDPFVVAYNQLGELWQTGMIEGGFAKLRNVSATYQLPRVWAQRIGADRASMTLAGENLATLWVEQCCVFGRKQVEPEIRSSTSELSDYNQEQFPQPRRLTAAFRVSF
ncbi:MAG: TonB-dependent receptor, partial [Gemmatimonadetes bacterium]|nr:TonB-dependent receptor [Gemmatimonadota bacterium]